MDDAFLGTEPAELGVVCESFPEGGGAVGYLFQSFSHDERLQRPDRRNDHLVAAPDRERESMTLVIAVRSQNHVGRRVVGILVDGVGARVDERGRETDIEHVERLDAHWAPDNEWL